MKKEASYKLLTAALALAVIAIVYIYSMANIYHYTAHMESDIASETLLAEVLYENGHMQPDTWQMSTARRIISAPMLASFIYPLTGYDLNTSMGVACSLLIVVLACAILFFNRQIGVGILESLTMLLMALVLSAPANETQRMLYLYASYYVGHFISMFIVLGVYAYMLKNRRISIIGCIITLPLAVVNGLQGTHASMFFYMPILGTEILRRAAYFIKKEKAPSGLVSLWVFAVSFISLIVPKFFGTYMVSDVSRNIRHAPEKFLDIVLPFALEVLGYGRLEILVIIFILAAVAGYIVAVKKLSDRPEFWSIFPILFGVIVVILSTTFSTAESAPRYYLMQIFVVGTGMAVLIDSYKPELTRYLAALAVIYGVFSAISFHEVLIKEDNSGDLEMTRMAEYMLDEGYEYGYSTFDFANAMTVISNNRVKIRAVNSFEEMEGAKWLSDSGWYPPFKEADMPTCYIVSDERSEDFQKFVEREKPLITGQRAFDGFTVYVTERDYTKWVD